MSTQQIAEQLRNLAKQIELTSEQHCAVDAVLNEEIHATSNPDPYAELKVARAAGKVIQSFNRERGGIWQDCPSPAFEGGTDYRIKPDAPSFQLPPPPPGMQWHRTDGWKAEDLPPGTRPLVLEEHSTNAAQQRYTGGWMRLSDSVIADPLEEHTRTTRPLVFTHEDKTWTWHRPGDPMPCDGGRRVYWLMVRDDARLASRCSEKAQRMRWSSSDTDNSSDIIGWRYADKPKMVELGPEDVTPLSIIRRKSEEQNWHWRLVSYVDAVKVTCADRGYPWTELATDYEINRSLPLTGKWNPNAWEPCHKPG